MPVPPVRAPLAARRAATQEAYRLTLPLNTGHLPTPSILQLNDSPDIEPDDDWEVIDRFTQVHSSPTSGLYGVSEDSVNNASTSTEIPVVILTSCNGITPVEQADQARLNEALGNLKTLNTRMLKLVNCPVCYEIAWQPCVLICGHMICGECLMHQAAHHIIEGENISAVQCGMCRRVLAPHPPAVDITLRDLVDALANGSGIDIPHRPPFEWPPSDLFVYDDAGTISDVEDASTVSDDEESIISDDEEGYLGGSEWPWFGSVAFA